MGKTPPQGTLHKKKQKNEKEQKTIAKELCPSLHENLATKSQPLTLTIQTLTLT
jgi:hypothetical protein